MMRLLLLLLLILGGMVGAQPAATDPEPAPVVDHGFELDDRGWPVGDDPEALADAAVGVWLDREPIAVTELLALPPAEACQLLPEALITPPPPEGTRVVLEERERLEPLVDEAATFTYAAVRPPDVLDVVQVDLSRHEDGWRVERVGFRTTTDLTGVRGWLQTPVASILFAVLTLVALIGLVRPSPLRRALALGLSTARTHRTTVAVTMALLYLVFGVGVWVGTSLPPECNVAVLTLVEGTVEQLGAQQAYSSGEVARAATVTFYQNFVVVAFGVHFFLSLLLGLPTYLLAVPQFFGLGVPFGLLGDFTLASLVPTVVLVLLELTAYFLVVSGGGILLGTLFRRGFGAYLEAVRVVASLLVPAGLLLLAAAWYEALLVISFLP